MKWTIIKERKRSLFWKYYFHAKAQENNDLFELECSWEQCVNCIFLYKNRHSTEEILFCATSDLDDCPSKYIKCILENTENNIESSAIRLAEALEDGCLTSVKPPWFHY